MWSVRKINDALVEALKQVREGDWFTLAFSPLSALPLVESAFLAGEPHSKWQMAWVISQVSRWGIETLKPGGSHSWLSPQWRHYNVLSGYYFEEMLVADLAEKMAIADQTFYEWRQQAILTLSRVLYDALDSADQVERCWRFVLNGRYTTLDPTAQTLLRLLSLPDSNYHLPIAWSKELLSIQDTIPTIENLTKSHLISVNSSQQTMQIHPQIQVWVQGQVSAAERVRWGRGLAQRYESIGDFIQSSHHHLRAGEPIEAAQRLIENQQAIFDQKQASSLQGLIRQFPKFEFEERPNLWAKLKLVAGRVAALLEDMETAVQLYGEALTAPNLLVKAEAYYARAKVLQRINLDECLAHYAVCIDLLERAFNEDASDEVQQLLTHMIIDRAWIYIQERPNFDRAAADLAKAKEVIPKRNSALWSDLLNAEASLAYQQNLLPETIEKRQMAWVSAAESGQVELMMKTAYNLGTDYLWNKQFESGLAYLEKAISLAKETNNIHVEGSAQKGIGNAFALMGTWETAVTHYLTAYQLFHEIKHFNFLTSLCIDLAEAYAELDQFSRARTYFQEAQQLSTDMGHAKYGAMLNDLSEKWPQLILNLTDRQKEAVTFARANDGIKRSQLVKLTNISKSQAHRDLEALCELDILERVGQGRATKYVLRNSNTDLTD